MKKKQTLGMLLALALLSAAGTAAWADRKEAGAGIAEWTTAEPAAGVMGTPGDFVMHAPPFAAVGPMPFSMPLSPMAGAMHLMMMLDDLDLDMEQREAVGKIMDSTLPKARDLMFRTSDNRKAVEQAMEDGVADEKALRKLADEQGRLMADTTFLHLKARSDLRAVLNEEQIAKLEGFRRGHAFLKRFHGRSHD